MSYIPVQELLKKTDSIYKLVILAARRAVELNEGAPPLVDSGQQKVSSVALEEIAQGKVRIKKDSV